MNFQGIIPALVTPMNDHGQVNFQSLRQLTNHLIEQGADGFYVCGSTAECFMLVDKERQAIVEAVTEEVNGRVPVVAHIGAVWADKAAELARHAQSCGVTAVSSVPPFYFKFGLPDITRYYQIISEAIDIPVIIYNIPDFTGVALNAANIRPILDSCRILGIKYTDYNLFELERIKRHYPQLNLYNGHDECMVNALPLGITGSIGSTFNILTPRFKQLAAAFQSGRIEQAMAIQREVNSIIDLLLSVPFFPALKYLTTRLGIDCGVCRRPFPELNGEQKRLLDTVLPRLAGQ